jgi:CYTH domain-containing protein
MSDTRFVAIRMRSAEDEARAPKYAHLERERRWLVDPAKIATLDLRDPIQIHDRYLTTTRMRLREMRMGDRTVWKLTKKYDCADPLARPIVTAYLSAEEYRALAALPAAAIEKTRFGCTTNGRDFSVDRFGGLHEGLLLAEIEIEDDDILRKIPDPDWTLRDVSDDARYQGGQLVAHGIPKE